MELEIDVEDLLSKRRLESDRIEFKTGWNPDDIYHSVCAFANDYNNDGGGYIVVGVEEENGVAKRPVKGLDRCRNCIRKWWKKLERIPTLSSCMMSWLPLRRDMQQSGLDGSS